MNGRIYDPVIGRFLSPDPFVQATGNPYNYNRYTYVLNNPLRFTDPSGYMYDPAEHEPTGPLLIKGYAPRYPKSWQGQGGDPYSGVGFDWENLASAYNNTMNYRPNEAGYGFDYYYTALEADDGSTYYAKNGTEYINVDVNSPEFSFDNVMGYFGFSSVEHTAGLFSSKTGYTGKSFKWYSYEYTGNFTTLPSIENYNSGSASIEGGDNKILDMVSASIGLEGMMIGQSAELTSRTVFRGTASQSAQQITRQNALIWGNAAVGINAASGTIGAITSYYSAVHDNASGNTGWALFNSGKTAAYIFGTGLLFVPIPGARVAAGYILLSTSAVDVAGAFFRYSKK